MKTTPRAGKLRKTTGRPCQVTQPASGPGPQHNTLFSLRSATAGPHSALTTVRSFNYPTSLGSLLFLHGPPPPFKLLSEPEGWMPRPSTVPHTPLHQPELDRPQSSQLGGVSGQISHDRPFLWSMSGIRKGCSLGSSKPQCCDQENLTSCIQWQP